MENVTGLLAAANQHLSSRPTPLSDADAETLWRLLAKITIEAASNCWLWRGSIGSRGYGNIKFRDGVWAAHRVSYTIFVGEIPAGLELDHTCRVRPCVNPDHLEPVTGEENVRRYLATLAGAPCTQGICSPSWAGVTPSRTPGGLGSVFPPNWASWASRALAVR